MKRQRLVLWIAIALAIGSILYPPWARTSARATVFVGYGWIFDPPLHAVIALPHLAAQTVLLGVALGALYLLFRSSGPSSPPRQESRPRERPTAARNDRAAPQSADDLPWWVVGLVIAGMFVLIVALYGVPTLGGGARGVAMWLAGYLGTLVGVLLPALGIIGIVWVIQRVRRRAYTAARWHFIVLSVGLFVLMLKGAGKL